MLLGGAEIDFTHNGSATPVAETGTASAARGLPDLGTAIAVDGGALYRAAEEPGHFLHVASALRVAGLEDGSGLPDLSLELVRGKTPSAPPKPYGVLDLRVAAGDPAPGALEAARGQDPRAFITPAVFGDGFVRLQVVAGQGALAPALREELAQPFALASNGLDSTRLIRRLTPEAALLLARRADRWRAHGRRGRGAVTARARRASARDRLLLPARAAGRAAPAGRQPAADRRQRDHGPVGGRRSAARQHGNRQRRATAARAGADGLDDRRLRRARGRTRRRGRADRAAQTARDVRAQADLGPLTRPHDHAHAGPATRPLRGCPRAGRQAVLARDDGAGARDRDHPDRRRHQLPPPHGERRAGRGADARGAVSA